MSLLSKEEQKFWKKYHIPSCSNLHSVKVDAVFYNINNTEGHELMKAKTCWEIKKRGHHFICEAERNELTNGKKRRVDIVCLSEEMEYEVETSIFRAKRFLCDKRVCVIPVNWNEEDLEKWKKLKKLSA